MIRRDLSRRSGRASPRKQWSPRSQRFVDAFIDACDRRDGAALSRVLRRDATLTIDSGGVVPVDSRAQGRVAVARLILDLLACFPGVRMLPGHVNGRPGIVLDSAGRVVGVMDAVRRGGAAQELWVVVNPDKLRSWNPM